MEIKENFGTKFWKSKKILETGAPNFGNQRKFWKNFGKILEIEENFGPKFSQKSNLSRVGPNFCKTAMWPNFGTSKVPKLVAAVAQLFFHAIATYFELLTLHFWA